MKTTEIRTEQELETIKATGMLTIVKFKGTAKDIFIVKGQKLAVITNHRTIGWVDGYGREHATKKAAIEAVIVNL